MPPAAIASSVVATRSSSPRRSRNSSVEAGGNFGAPPKPPHSGSKPRAQAARRLGEDRVGQRLARRGERRDDARTASTSRRADSATSSRRSRYACATASQHLAEARQPVPRRRREVRAAEERLALGRQEDGHRPAAVPGQRDDRVHVDRVEVGPLLAVDLDADEVLVHQRRRLRVLERLVLHHVAPVARGVADREQDRPVLVPRAGRAPPRPTGTSRPGSRRAGGGRGWSPRRGGSFRDDNRVRGPSRHTST